MDLIKERLATGNDWTFELISEYDRVIAGLADEYGLDTYANQIEVIHSEQMMDAYASSGMPVGYLHWSYGKNFLGVKNRYQRGHMGLAFEIVINSDPCIAYLMEENTATMQALVIAHACYGHNSFFKGNYLFRDWTDAGSIVDYLVFARSYINECEQRYGQREVEETLDSCHALMNFGVDRYQRPPKLSAQRERERQRDREANEQSRINVLWDTTISKSAQTDKACFPAEPQENILYFIEKHAQKLHPWQREIVRIVRKIAQYFYPQRQTQLMNEGWASYWHYTLLNTLYDRGHVDDGFMLEFLQSHSNVLYQPSFDSPQYSGFNPYALGFAIYKDIERICLDPTEEDKAWFPDWAGSDAPKMLDHAMRNYKDESFVQQFLSPKVMREFRMFHLKDDDHSDTIGVESIHNNEGFKAVRQILATNYNLGVKEADIQVVHVNRDGDRSLTLHHRRRNRVPLDSQAEEVLKHLHRLWGFDVHLLEYEGDVCVGNRDCPARAPSASTAA